MAFRELRYDSDVPNISKEDDYNAFRYATKGMNGVLPNVGQRCSSTLVGALSKTYLRINSGQFVLDGVQYEIDSEGVEIELPNISGDYYILVAFDLHDSDSSPPKFEASIEHKKPVIDIFSKNYLAFYLVTMESGTVKYVEKVFRSFDGLTTAQALADSSGNVIEETYSTKTETENAIKNLLNPDIEELHTNLIYKISIYQSFALNSSINLTSQFNVINDEYYAKYHNSIGRMSAIIHFSLSSFGEDFDIELFDTTKTPYNNDFHKICYVSTNLLGSGGASFRVYSTDMTFSFDRSLTQKKLVLNLGNIYMYLHTASGTKYIEKLENIEYYIKDITITIRESY